MVIKMKLCLLKVIIKEINYLDQPKPHQGLAEELHTVPLVGQRCTVAQPPPPVSAAWPRSGPRVPWFVPGPNCWATLSLEDIGQTGRDLLNNKKAARPSEGSEAIGPPDPAERHGEQKWSYLPAPRKDSKMPQGERKQTCDDNQREENKL